jgi:hypothetical protein
VSLRGEREPQTGCSPRSDCFEFVVTGKQPFVWPAASVGLGSLRTCGSAAHENRRFATVKVRNADITAVRNLLSKVRKSDLSTIENEMHL